MLINGAAWRCLIPTRGRGIHKNAIFWGYWQTQFEKHWPAQLFMSEVSNEMITLPLYHFYSWQKSGSSMQTVSSLLLINSIYEYFISYIPILQITSIFLQIYNSIKNSHFLFVKFSLNLLRYTFVVVVISSSSSLSWSSSSYTLCMLMYLVVYTYYALHLNLNDKNVQFN